MSKLKVIKFFFIKYHNFFAYIMLILFSLISSTFVLSILSAGDKETQESMGNILVLLLIFLSTRLKNHPNSSLTFVVDFFNVTVAFVLSVHLFKAGSRDFFTVTNEILAIILVPYVLYSPIKERQIEKKKLLDNILKIKGTSNSEKLQLTNGQDKADHAAIQVVKSYIERINLTLESYSGPNRCISVPVLNVDDVIVLCRSFHLIQDYYRSQGYEFLVRAGKQEITIRWPFIK